MMCRTAVVYAAILLLSANTVRADDGMGPSPTACEKSGDAGQWSCLGTEDVINCEYVCDDYDPMSRTDPSEIRIATQIKSTCR